MTTKERVYSGPYENMLDLDELGRDYPKIARRFEHRAGIQKPRRRAVTHLKRS